MLALLGEPKSTEYNQREIVRKANKTEPRVAWKKTRPGGMVKRILREVQSRNTGGDSTVQVGKGKTKGGRRKRRGTGQVVRRKGDGVWRNNEGCGNGGGQKNIGCQLEINYRDVTNWDVGENERAFGQKSTSECANSKTVGGFHKNG